MDNKEKFLTDEERAAITHQSKDQVFGDNDQAKRNFTDENGHPTTLHADVEAETTARRTRDVLKESEEARDRLEKKKNDVHDYDEDAREMPL